MSKLLLTLGMALSTLTVSAQATVIPASQIQAGWKLAAKCSSYSKACAMADRLEDKGYCTKITKASDGDFCVWCK